jgi:hypothetical protein
MSRTGFNPLQMCRQRSPVDLTLVSSGLPPPRRCIVGLPGMVRLGLLNVLETQQHLVLRGAFPPCGQSEPRQFPDDLAQRSFCTRSTIGIAFSRERPVVGRDGGLHFEIARHVGLAFADAPHLRGVEGIQLLAALVVPLRMDLAGPPERKYKRLLQRTLPLDFAADVADDPPSRLRRIRRCRLNCLAWA